MNETYAASEISACISLIGLLVLMKLLREHTIDSFRDRMFALRDEVFLYACDENLLDSPAHMNLRRLMNGMIRYAHRTSLARLLTLDLARKVFRVPLKVPSTYAEWLVAVDTLPADQAKRLHQFHSEAMMLAVRHMISASPILWFVFAVLAIYFRICRSTKLVRDAVVNVVRRQMPEDLLEAEAFKAAGS
jgi:hypothetical protein